MADITINYLAVIIAAIASFAVGGLWYSPILFGKKWQAEMGFTPESMKAMKMSPTAAYIGFLIVALIMSYVLAHFVQYLGVTNMAGAWQAAFWIWLGFMVPITAGDVLWEGKSWMLFFINAAYNLVSLGVMAAILSLWK